MADANLIPDVPTLEAALSEFGVVTTDQLTLKSRRVLAIEFDYQRARGMSSSEKTSLKVRLLGELSGRLDKLLFPRPRGPVPGA